MQKSRKLIKCLYRFNACIIIYSYDVECFMSEALLCSYSDLEQISNVLLCFNQEETTVYVTLDPCYVLCAMHDSRYRSESGEIGFQVSDTDEREDLRRLEPNCLSFPGKNFNFHRFLSFFVRTT